MEKDLFENIMNFSAKKIDKESPTKTEDKKPKVKKKSDVLIERIGRNYDLSELEDVIRTKGDQLIISCAGSGKTTGLVFKVIYDSITGEITTIKEINGRQVRVMDSVWVCTFLKTGAEELKSRLKESTRKMGCVDISSNIAFSTLHAEFKRSLSNLGYLTNIISEKENTKLLKDVLKILNVKYCGKALNNDLVEELKTTLTNTRNRIGSNRYGFSTYSMLNIGSSTVDTILNFWQSERFKRNLVDFEDLQEILYDLCYVQKNKEVIDYLASRYNYIYIDEFQDTSQIQYALLKVYASGCKKIVAIGDDDQTIYSWRGSDINVMTKSFIEDFSPKITTLSTNYRCPSNILNSIAPSIKNNKNRFDKEIKANKDGGEMNLIKCTSLTQMSNYVLDNVYKDVSNGKSVTILVRSNMNGLVPALAFERMGTLDFKISGTGMTMNNGIGEMIFKIIYFTSKKYSPGMRKVLNSLSWDSYGINQLVKICSTRSVSIWDLEDSDIQYSCDNKLAKALIKMKKVRQLQGEMGLLKYILKIFRYEIYTSGNVYTELCNSVIDSVLVELESFEGEHVLDFYSYIKDLNTKLNARISTNRYDFQIATVHEFKGKESDCVYIWNDSEDVFPCTVGTKLDGLSESQMEEERRVHYIACTRAREKCTILTVSGSEGQFLDEMDFTTVNIDSIKISNRLGKSPIDELFGGE